MNCLTGRAAGRQENDIFGKQCGIQACNGPTHGKTENVKWFFVQLDLFHKLMNKELKLKHINPESLNIPHAGNLPCQKRECPCRPPEHQTHHVLEGPALRCVDLLGGAGSSLCYIIQNLAVYISQELAGATFLC